MSFDLKSMHNAHIARLSPYQPGKPIEELQRELGVKDVIKLASNENPLGSSPKALEAAMGELPEVNFYPDGAAFAFKEVLAERLGVTTDQITLGNGSDDVIGFIVRVFVDAGHEAIISQYAFAAYPVAVNAVGGQLKVIPAKDWGHDLEAMAAAVTDKTRVVFIANPNNPTGTWSDKQSLEKFLAAVPQNVIVVVDEAYFEYIRDPRYPCAIDYLQQYPNLIVTRTFSKIYGLAGLRLGYGVSHPEVADLLNRVRLPFNANSAAQAAGIAALGDGEWQERSYQHNQQGLSQLAAGLERLGLPYIPSVGNFITADMGRSGDEVYQALLKLGVIIRPLTPYKMPNHLRITVGTKEEIDRCLSALEQVLGA